MYAQQPTSRKQPKAPDMLTRALAQGLQRHLTSLGFPLARHVITDGQTITPVRPGPGGNLNPEPRMIQTWTASLSDLDTQVTVTFKDQPPRHFTVTVTEHEPLTEGSQP